MIDRAFNLLLCFLILQRLPVDAGPVLQGRASPSGYAPYNVSCSTPTPRVAVSLSSGEASYVASRKQRANPALLAWLQRYIPLSAQQVLPTVGLVLSGGGPKAGLTSAGVFQALDGRDSSAQVAGLLQGLTYIAALSGGSLTLTGVMTNNFTQVSILKSKLYNKNYQDLFAAPLAEKRNIDADIDAKAAAHYNPSLIDVYGRGLAVNVIGGPGNASGETWSGLLSKSAFTNFIAPLPIMTFIDALVPSHQCGPQSTSPIWEATPFEFGSWDQQIQLFYPTQYLATPLTNKGVCTAGFDNTGFLCGVSSDILISGSGCSTDGAGGLTALGAYIKMNAPSSAGNIGYGLIPNPFYKPSAVPPSRFSQKTLFMMDGGFSKQVMPLVPFLQPARKVNVIIAADLQSSVSTNITNGSSLVTTSAYAQANKLSLMPVTPTVEQVLQQKLTSSAQFFGCYKPDVATMIWLPNTYSNFSDQLFKFDPVTLNAVFQSGIDMTTQRNNPSWATCLACGIIHKNLTSIPAACTTCLKQYCWPRSTT